MKNLKLFFKDVAEWQVEETGKECTLCYGNNMYNECISCGWWGLCAPDGFTPKTKGPDLDNERYDLPYEPDHECPSSLCDCQK